MEREHLEKVVMEMMDIPIRFRKLVREEDGQMLISPKRLVLKVLAHEGPQPMSVLAKRLNVTKQYVTAIVGRLVEEGLVERRTDPSDRRMVIIVLKPEGEAEIVRSKEKVMGAFTRRLSRLSDDDQERFLEALRELSSIISTMEDVK